MGKKADGSRTGEQVDIRSLAEMPGLQLMRASFHTRTFPRHCHEGYGVGVIEQGALGFYYRGENVVAPAGRINTVNPDEVHTGQAATESGWTYRMFYFSADFLQHMTRAVCERPTTQPFFTQGVIEDPDLAGLICQVHGQLGDIRVARLERETMLLEMFARLLVRHTYEPPTIVRAGREEAPIRRVIDYLDAHFGEDLAVDTLAAIACLSSYHFIRVFTRQTGLTPHAWLMQLRAHKAKELLALGLPIADAALQTGFADQSHLNKIFKRIMGYTPGQLRNSVQDA
jgi:AraC-like DNA-binding protein